MLSLSSTWREPFMKSREEPFEKLYMAAVRPLHGRRRRVGTDVVAQTSWHRRRNERGMRGRNSLAAVKLRGAARGAGERQASGRRERRPRQLLRVCMCCLSRLRRCCDWRSWSSAATCRPVPSLNSSRSRLQSGGRQSCLSFPFTCRRCNAYECNARQSRRASSRTRRVLAALLGPFFGHQPSLSSSRDVSEWQSV